MSFTRIAGMGGLVFATTVTSANVFLAGAAKPLGSPDLTEIVAYYSTHGRAVRFLSLVAPIAWVGIALFSAGLVVWTRRSDGRSSGWALMGLAGIAMMVPTFCCVVTVDVALAAGASSLADNPQYTRALWDFHMVIQILNWTFIAIALGGFGMAALTSGAAPRLGWVALPGAAALLVGATLSWAGLTGARSIFVGLPGFVVWLVFVVGCSVALIRSRSLPGAADRA